MPTAEKKLRAQHEGGTEDTPLCLHMLCDMKISGHNVQRSPVFGDRLAPAHSRPPTQKTAHAAQAKKVRLLLACHMSSLSKVINHLPGILQHLRYAHLPLPQRAKSRIPLFLIRLTGVDLASELGAPLRQLGPVCAYIGR